MAHRFRRGGQSWHWRGLIKIDCFYGGILLENSSVCRFGQSRPLRSWAGAHIATHSSGFIDFAGCKNRINPAGASDQIGFSDYRFNFLSRYADAISANIGI
jgi:hypothetical protein